MTKEKKVTTQMLDRQFNSIKEQLEKILTKYHKIEITLTKSTHDEDTKLSMDASYRVRNETIHLSIRERDTKYFGFEQLTLRLKSESGYDVEVDKLDKLLTTNKHKHYCFYYYKHYELKDDELVIDNWYLINFNRAHHYDLLNNPVSTFTNHSDGMVVGCYNLSTFHENDCILCTDDKKYK